MTKNSQLDIVQWVLLCAQPSIVVLILYWARDTGGVRYAGLASCEGVYEYNMFPKFAALILFGCVAVGITAYTFKTWDHWFPQISVWVVGIILILCGLFVPAGKTVITAPHDCNSAAETF